jgi:hypothetical protein
MPKKFKTRSDENIAWIEKWCVTPFGPERGQHVRLSDTEMFSIRQIYDREAGQPLPTITDNLAAFLALLHLCGPMALSNDPLPPIEIDSWTVWHSAGVTLHPWLKREGGVVICRKLGTRFPAAAA